VLGKKDCATWGGRIRLGHESEPEKTRRREHVPQELSLERERDSICVPFRNFTRGNFLFCLRSLLHTPKKENLAKEDIRFDGDFDFRELEVNYYRGAKQQDDLTTHN
jgi:hypothetical protein